MTLSHRVFEHHTAVDRELNLIATAPFKHEYEFNF